MSRRLPDQEAVLEGGLIAVSAMLLGSLAVLALGRLVGDRQRRQRHRAAAPAVGSIPAERHQHILTVAPR